MKEVTEIIFEIHEAEEGGYWAKSLGYGIFTQGETWEELKENIRDAIECSFENSDEQPSIIRYELVGSASSQDSSEEKIMEVVPKSVTDIERLFKGLADENRLKIIFLLNELGEACVSDIQKILRLPQPTVSRHLQLLMRMGILNKRRKGRWSYYYLVKKQPDIVRTLLHCLVNNKSYCRLFRLEMRSGIDKLLKRSAAPR